MSLPCLSFLPASGQDRCGRPLLRPSPVSWACPAGSGGAAASLLIERTPPRLPTAMLASRTEVRDATPAAHWRGGADPVLCDIPDPAPSLRPACYTTSITSSLFKSVLNTILYIFRTCFNGAFRLQCPEGSGTVAVTPDGSTLEGWQVAQMIPNDFATFSISRACVRGPFLRLKLKNWTCDFQKLI